jgi:hypothetical protein
VSVRKTKKACSKDKWSPQPEMFGHYFTG